MIVLGNEEKIKKDRSRDMVKDKINGDGKRSDEEMSDE